MTREAFAVKELVCLNPRNKYLNLFRVGFERLGKSHNYFLATRNPEPILGTPKVNAIIVVATVQLPDEDFRRLVVTEEFRISIGGYEWGLCAGIRDGNESAEDTARRELKEETGLDCDAILKVSPPLISSAGMGDECFQMVWVTAKGAVSREYLEATEDIHTELMDYKDVVQLCDRVGRFEDAMISGRAWPIFDQIKERGYI
jgi:8-oxo-dGTP pyrophosphatase MutT (NUDIX family)